MARSCCDYGFGRIINETTKYWEYLLLLAIMLVTGGVLVTLPARAYGYASYGIIFVGSIILILYVLTDGRQKLLRWITIGLSLIAAVALGFSLIGFTLLLATHRLSHQAYHFLYSARLVLGGMGIGIFLLLVISGQFVNFSLNQGSQPQDR